MRKLLICNTSLLHIMVTKLTIFPNTIIYKSKFWCNKISHPSSHCYRSPREVELTNQASGTNKVGRPVILWIFMKHSWNRQQLQGGVQQCNTHGSIPLPHLYHAWYAYVCKVNSYWTRPWGVFNNAILMVVFAYSVYLCGMHTYAK